jgi:hypothetical protein
MKLSYHSKRLLTSNGKSLMSKTVGNRAAAAPLAHAREPNVDACVTGRKPAVKIVACVR